MKRVTVQEGIKAAEEGKKVKLIVAKPIDATLTLGEIWRAAAGDAYCEIEEEEEKPKVKKEPKCDKGKVYALADAGWSQKKIADEMKVTEGYISQLIKARG